MCNDCESQHSLYITIEYIVSHGGMRHDIDTSLYGTAALALGAARRGAADGADQLSPLVLMHYKLMGSRDSPRDS